MKEETTTLAKRIYESRKSMGLTQEVMADKLGITPQSISRWENGQSRPDVDMLPKLAAFFGVSIDALFGYHAENLKITQYEDKYKRSEYYWGNQIRRLARAVLGLMPPSRPINLLEIGCGDGQAAVFFARNGYVVSAFDAEESSLAKGEKIAKQVGVNVNFFRANLLTYKIENKFDIIYSSGVLQYVPPSDRAQIFEMIQEHTEVGGLNVLNTFVDKSFIPVTPDKTKYEYLYNTAELFGYYGSDWKFEILEEVYFDCESSGVKHKHCMDAMIARKMR